MKRLDMCLEFFQCSYRPTVAADSRKQTCASTQVQIHVNVEHTNNQAFPLGYRQHTSEKNEHQGLTLRNCHL